MTGALQHGHLPTLQRSSLLENRRTVSAVEPVLDTARRILTHRQLWRNWQNCFNTLFKEQKMNIRKAKLEDLSRIAEIYVFNNRINYYPIFQTPEYSFGELQVVSVIDNYFKKDEILQNIYVSEDDVIKGFIQITGTEICKLYVEPCFQGEEVGKQLLQFAVEEFGADHLWALEKNRRAIAFYNRNGFLPSGKRQFEEGTTEYLIELVRREQK